MSVGKGGKILVIEDEAHIRSFLRISLEAHGFEVREARLGQEGLVTAADWIPGLVILDLGLPDIDGRAVIQRLREWSQTPILVLSVRSDESEKVELLDAGANDYVTKPFGIAELMARVRAVFRDNRAKSPVTAVHRFGELYIDLARRYVSLAGVSISLSPKEYDLLRLLVLSAGQVLTHRHILREIWGAGHEGDTHYLRVLIGHLRQKLNDSPGRPARIRTVPGVGYRFGPAD